MIFFIHLMLVFNLAVFIIGCVFKPINNEKENTVAAVKLKNNFDEQTRKIQTLIATNANINAQDDFGITALMQAAWKGNNEAIKLLLDAGADVNTQCKYGKRTALFYAALYDGTPETIQLLLAAGADIHLHSDSETALAAAVRRGKIEVVRTLIAAGMDVNAKPGYGGTALFWAVNCGYI